MASLTVMEWAREELIPLLNFVWVKPPVGSWDVRIQDISETIQSLKVYEDFDSTVERIRLLLVNPGTLTRAETMDFGWMRREIDMCIGVFVRHAMRHGTYKLWSLGTEPDPDHPRRKLTEEDQDTYIYGGKLAAKDPQQRRLPERMAAMQNIHTGPSRGGYQGDHRGVYRGGYGANPYGGGLVDPGGRQELKPRLPQEHDNRFGMGKLSLHAHDMLQGGPVRKMPTPNPGGSRFGCDGVVPEVEVLGGSSELHGLEHAFDMMDFHGHTASQSESQYGWDQGEDSWDMPPVMPRPNGPNGLQMLPTPSNQLQHRPHHHVEADVEPSVSSDMENPVLRPDAREFIPGAWGFR